MPQWWWCLGPVVDDLGHRERGSEEVLAHIAALDGVNLSITVEVHATRAEGFPEVRVRILLENARTLRFESYGFED